MRRNPWFHWSIIIVMVTTMQCVFAQERGGRISPHVAKDCNPDPKIVEVYIDARQSYSDFGQGWTRVWAYRDAKANNAATVPGPTIEANVGDTLIVHFTNYLPVPTTIHWHGVELPANMDGSDIAQNAVPACGGEFVYKFELLTPSLYWYHPHINPHIQIERGLYGALLVHDPKRDKELGLPEREHILVFDDVRLDRCGQIEQPFPHDPVEFAATQVNGRIGETLLVNGYPHVRCCRPYPIGNLERGVPVRFRIINASNSRFMRISIPGQQVWRIGGDGGLLQHPIKIKTIQPDAKDPKISSPDLSQGLLLTPAERADIVFTPSGSGPIQIEWHDLPRGRHIAKLNNKCEIELKHDPQDGRLPKQRLVTFNTYGSAQVNGSEYVPRENLRSIERIEDKDKPIIKVTFAHQMKPAADGSIIFGVQAKKMMMKKEGKPMMMIMPIPFKKITQELAQDVHVGETWIWEIENTTSGHHNFHAHGWFFQLIETKYVDKSADSNDRNKNYTVKVPKGATENKDTILIPRYKTKMPMGHMGGMEGMEGGMMQMGTKKTITRLAVTFLDRKGGGGVLAEGKKPCDKKSGGWIFHCHINEHSARGMKSFIEVKPK